MVNNCPFVLHKHMIELLCNSAATLLQLHKHRVGTYSFKINTTKNNNKKNKMGRIVATPLYGPLQSTLFLFHFQKPSLNPYAPLNRISFSFYSTAPPAAAAAAAAAAVMVMGTFHFNHSIPWFSVSLLTAQSKLSLSLSLSLSS